MPFTSANCRSILRSGIRIRGQRGGVAASRDHFCLQPLQFSSPTLFDVFRFFAIFYWQDLQITVPPCLMYSAILFVGIIAFFHGQPLQNFLSLPVRLINFVAFCLILISLTNFPFPACLVYSAIFSLIFFLQLCIFLLVVGLASSLSLPV